jgi:ribosomal protein S12
MKKLFLIIVISLIFSGCITIKKMPGGRFKVCKTHIFKKKNKVKKNSNHNYKVKKPRLIQI